MKPAQINWIRLPVKGVAGLIFAVGLCVLIGVALPETLVVIVPAVILGALAGLGVGLWRHYRD